MHVNRNGGVAAAARGGEMRTDVTRQYKCRLHNIPAIFFKFGKFYMLLHLLEMSYFGIYEFPTFLFENI